jgi:hypothetical protein
MPLNALQKPFFKYFGSKRRHIFHYPPPRYDLIVEPFAGAASYALEYPSKQVHLYDVDPHVCRVWKYLISVPEREILSLPDIKQGTTLSEYNLTAQQATLIGYWLGASGRVPRQVISPWAASDPSAFWSKGVRETIASQLQFIRHWKIFSNPYTMAPNNEATWFIDPPYQGKGGSYLHGKSGIDYTYLRDWCNRRSGQVIVCEQEGAEWLPFRHLIDIQGARLNSTEVIWTNENS